MDYVDIFNLFVLSGRSVNRHKCNVYALVRHRLQDSIRGNFNIIQNEKLTKMYYIFIALERLKAANTQRPFV